MDPKKLLISVFVFIFLATAPAMALEIFPDFTPGQTFFTDPNSGQPAEVNVNLWNDSATPADLQIFSIGNTFNGSFLRSVAGDVLGTFSLDPGEIQSVNALSFFPEKLDFTTFSYVAADIGDIVNVMTMSFVGMLDDMFTSWTLDAESYGLDYLFSVEVGTATVVTAPVPEPATLLLLGSGFIGLVWWRQKKQQA